MTVYITKEKRKWKIVDKPDGPISTDLPPIKIGDFNVKDQKRLRNIVSPEQLLEELKGRKPKKGKTPKKKIKKELKPKGLATRLKRTKTEVYKKQKAEELTKAVKKEVEKTKPPPVKSPFTASPNKAPENIVVSLPKPKARKGTTYSIPTTPRAERGDSPTGYEEAEAKLREVKRHQKNARESAKESAAILKPFARKPKTPPLAEPKEPKPLKPRNLKEEKTPEAKEAQARESALKRHLETEAVKRGEEEARATRLAQIQKNIEKANKNAKNKRLSAKIRETIPKYGAKKKREKLRNTPLPPLKLPSLTRQESLESMGTKDTPVFEEHHITPPDTKDLAVKKEKFLKLVTSLQSQARRRSAKKEAEKKRGNKAMTDLLKTLSQVEEQTKEQKKEAKAKERAERLQATADERARVRAEKVEAKAKKAELNRESVIAKREANKAEAKAKAAARIAENGTKREKLKAEAATLEFERLREASEKAMSQLAQLEKLNVPPPRKNFEDEPSPRSPITPKPPLPPARKSKPPTIAKPEQISKKLAEEPNPTDPTLTDYAFIVKYEKLIKKAHNENDIEGVKGNLEILRERMPKARLEDILQPKNPKSKAETEPINIDEYIKESIPKPSTEKEPTIAEIQEQIREIEEKPGRRSKEDAKKIQDLKGTLRLYSPPSEKKKRGKAPVIESSSEEEPEPEPEKPKKTPPPLPPRKTKTPPTSAPRSKSPPSSASQTPRLTEAQIAQKIDALEKEERSIRKEIKESGSPRPELQRRLSAIEDSKVSLTEVNKRPVSSVALEQAITEEGEAKPEVRQHFVKPPPKGAAGHQTKGQQIKELEKQKKVLEEELLRLEQDPKSRGADRKEIRNKISQLQKEFQESLFPKKPETPKPETPKPAPPKLSMREQAEADEKESVDKEVRRTRTQLEQARAKLEKLNPSGQYYPRDKTLAKADIKRYEDRLKALEKPQSVAKESSALPLFELSEREAKTAKSKEPNFNKPPPKGSGLGGKLKGHQVNKFVEASYKKLDDANQVGDYVLDRELSTKNNKVYRDPNTGKVVVANAGTSSLGDWWNNKNILFGNYSKTKRYKEVEDIQKKAIAKYGKDNITNVGHSQSGEALRIMKKNGLLGEAVAVNPAIIGKSTEDIDVIRSDRDLVSLLTPTSGKDTTIKAQTFNPLTEHSSNIISGENEEKEYGRGIAHKTIFDKIHWGSFSKEFINYRRRHPEINSLEEFAQHIIEHPNQFSHTTLHRAMFYDNVIRHHRA